MKALLTLLIVGGAASGAIYYETGQNPIEFFKANDPTRHIDDAQQAADEYGSATDRRLEAEFGTDWQGQNF